MSSSAIQYSETRDLPLESVVALYRANEWSSAEKPTLLHQALLASHSLVTAWDGDTLAGLGNAISDGYLVVYYPHLLVLPAYQGRGIGQKLVTIMLEKLKKSYMIDLICDTSLQKFYKKLGMFPSSGMIKRNYPNQSGNKIC